MGRTRYQEGSLRLESRKRGKVWRLRFRITRADGNRVEHAIVIGTQKELPTRAAAREFVKSLYLPINHPAPNNNGRPVTFSDIAGHYIQEELSRRSKPSIGSESLFHDCNLPPLSAQVGFATMGRSGGLDDRATRSRELAERAGEEERSRKPNPVEDPTGHRSGLQTCPTCWIPAADGAGESDPLCPPVHGQQLRPDHFDSGSSLRDHQPTGVDAAYACAGHRGHCVADLRNPRAAVEGHRRRESMHIRPSSLRLWEIRQTQVEGVKASRSAPSSTRGTSAQLAPGNALQPGRESRVPVLQTKGQEATASQHAFVRSSSPCGS